MIADAEHVKLDDGVSHLVLFGVLSLTARVLAGCAVDSRIVGRGYAKGDHVHADRTEASLGTEPADADNNRIK